MSKCKHYNEYEWGEPPSEPGENGKLIREYECKIASGYFVACCDGDKSMCMLPDRQNKELQKIAKEQENEKNNPEKK